MSSAERLKTITAELRVLDTELHRLSERARVLVEELENDFPDTRLPSEVKMIFFTMQRLLTKV